MGVSCIETGGSYATGKLSGETMGRLRIVRTYAPSKLALAATLLSMGFVKRLKCVSVMSEHFRLVRWILAGIPATAIVLLGWTDYPFIQAERCAGLPYPRCRGPEGHEHFGHTAPTEGA